MSFGLGWSEKLSYDNLQSEGLVNSFAEWESLKDGFDAKFDTDDSVISWLKLQKIPFRTSHLTHKLISGYIQFHCLFDKDVVQDIQNIIIAFCNLILIKLVYTANDNKYEIKALDTNLTFRTLAKLLEIENKDKWKIYTDTKYHYAKKLYSDYVRIWCKYKWIKSIYPITARRVTITEENLDSLNIDSLKWMEIPDDYMHMIALRSIDADLDYDEVLEIGVDFYDENDSKWPWSFKKDDYSKLSRDKWLKTLRCGDIINARDFADKWYEVWVRYIDGTSLYIHWIGWNVKWDCIYDFNEGNSGTNKREICLEIAKKYSHQSRAHRANRSRNEGIVKRDFDKTFLFSWKIT